MNRRCAVAVTVPMLLMVLLAAPWWAPTIAAGPLEEAMHATASGKFRFSYTARPGVYGWRNGGVSIGHNDSDSDWRPECDPCPVHLTLSLEDGGVVQLRSRLGGRWRSTPRGLTDLGHVGGSEAAEFLMSVVERARANAAEEALDAAALAADVELWPRLLRIARDKSRDHELREKAIFWVGQAAQETVVDELRQFTDDEEQDLELRRHAVFALSQQPAEVSVPALMRIADDHRDASVRQSALFWLTQKDDPRVLDFFEKILTDER